MLLELKSKSSLKIGCLLYDVIRVIYREYNPKEVDGDVHLANTLDLMEAADLLLAISKWTIDTSCELAQNEGRNHQPIKILPLGVDLSTARLDPKEEAALRNEVTQRSFALVVGSVEPRKNVVHLLEVWDELMRSGTPPLDLVIVGRQGYGAEAEAQLITSHPLFDRHVFWLDSCPDRVLTSLYQMATVVLCPSHVEGWGLPVSEALLQGRPVIASDTSAHPEAAFGQAVLLGARDISAWADAIRRVAATPDSFLPDVTRIGAPTWEQVGQHLIKLLETRFALTPQSVDADAHSTN
jgi:glycosyltransferase involved in cell wall biosynthesis